jgi:hypothetical protein
MPAVAQWSGTPKVKGSSESMRMALLTASLIGLQYLHLPICIVRQQRAHKPADSLGTSK